MTRRHPIDGPLVVVTRDDPAFDSSDLRGWLCVWSDDHRVLELVSDNIAGLRYWRAHPLIRATECAPGYRRQRRPAPRVWPDKDDLDGRDALRLETGGRYEQEEWERMDMERARY